MPIATTKSASNVEQLKAERAQTAGALAEPIENLNTCVVQTYVVAHKRPFGEIAKVASKIELPRRQVSDSQIITNHKATL